MDISRCKADRTVSKDISNREKFKEKIEAVLSNEDNNKIINKENKQEELKLDKLIDVIKDILDKKEMDKSKIMKICIVKNIKKDEKNNKILISFSKTHNTKKEDNEQDSKFNILIKIPEEISKQININKLKQKIKEMAMRENALTLDFESLKEISYELSRIDTFVNDLYISILNFYNRILKHENLKDIHEEVKEHKENFITIHSGRNFKQPQDSDEQKVSVPQ